MRRRVYPGILRLVDIKTHPAFGFACAREARCNELEWTMQLKLAILGCVDGKERP